MAKKEVERGIVLPCPCCGEEQAEISLRLDNMKTFTCHSCDTEFELRTIELIIEKWQRVVAWIDLAPMDE